MKYSRSSENLKPVFNELVCRDKINSDIPNEKLPVNIMIAI